MLGSLTLGTPEFAELSHPGLDAPRGYGGDTTEVLRGSGERPTWPTSGHPGGCVLAHVITIKTGGKRAVFVAYSYPPHPKAN